MQHFICICGSGSWCVHVQIEPSLFQCPSLSAGLLDTVMALRLSWYLRNEREYVPWRAAIDWIFTFAQRLSLTPLFGNYQVVLSRLLAVDYADVIYAEIERKKGFRLRKVYHQTTRLHNKNHAVVQFQPLLPLLVFSLQHRVCVLRTPLIFFLRSL